MDCCDDVEMKFSNCPPAVRKTFEAEGHGTKFETVTKEKDDEGGTVYWADASIGGKSYAIGVLEDGTLTEMNLAVDENEIALDQCPAPVKETLNKECFGEKLGAIERDVKYGLIVFETAVNHKGKSYEIVVAEDGTLVEKVLVIDDDEVKLSDCPAAVRAALHEHSAGGEIGEVTRSTGIGEPTFEAEVKTRGKVYLIEVAASGILISKSLEAIKD
jgi:hypothetical protein